MESIEQDNRIQNNHVFYEAVGLNTQKTNVPMCLSIICTYLLLAAYLEASLPFHTVRKSSLALMQWGHYRV